MRAAVAAFFQSKPNTSDQHLPQKVESIDVHSMDADHCTLPFFYENSSYVSMTEYNQTFIDNLLQQHKNSNSKPSQIIFMLGSARQGPRRDFVGMHQSNPHYYFTESIFPAFADFVRDIKSRFEHAFPSEYDNCDETDTNTTVTHDRFLLSEILNFDQESFITNKVLYGLGWNSALKAAIEKKDLKDLPALLKEISSSLQILTQNDVIDHPSKFLLLYAQIHHIANKYPNKKINFHFHDDSYKHILKPLFDVLSAHPDLVPSNITVHFHLHIKGKNCDSDIPPVIGTGTIDTCFRQTVRDIVTTMPRESIPIPFKQNTTMDMPRGDVLNMLFTFENNTVSPTDLCKNILAARNARLKQPAQETTLHADKAFSF